MELIDRQRELTAAVEKLRKDIADLNIQVRKSQKALNEFTKEHGNFIHKAKQDAEWKIQKAENAKRRATSEWQVWHKEWKAKQAAEEAARPVVAPKITAGMNPGEVFFIRKGLPKTDKELFFGPLDGTEEFVVFDDTWMMAHILVHVGIFPSLSQARKNGGDGPIPAGFTMLVRGKKMKRREMVILNKF